MSANLNPTRSFSPITPKAWTFVARVMKPLIRILLRLGFSADQISQMARKLTVDAAMEHPEFRPPHRKRAFVAHAAVVTGLSRKEVAKLRDMEDLQEALDSRQVNRSVRVLAGWRNDRRYRDPETDKPLSKLPFKTASGVSFHQLAREYAGDVPPRSVLDALIRTGALTRKGNTIELVRDYPTQAHGPDEELDFIGIMLGNALGTAEFDLRPCIEARQLFREWYQAYVPEERLADAKSLIREETMEFGRRLDERLAELAHRAPKANTRYRRVGLGAYYTETDSDIDGG